MSWWPPNQPNHPETVRYSTMGAFQKPLSLQLISDDVPRTPESTSAQKISTPAAPRRPCRPSESSPYDARGNGAHNRYYHDEDVTSENGEWRQGPSWGANESFEERIMRFAHPQQSPMRTANTAIGQTASTIHCEALPKGSILPRPDRSNTRQVTNTRSLAAETIVIERAFAIETPETLADDDLTLLGFGPSLAVALYDQLFLWNQDGHGRAELFTCTDDEAPISCVKWQKKAIVDQQETPLIALGLENVVEIWAVREEGHVVQAFPGQHSGFVTSICWKGDGRELLAGSKSGIKRHTLLRTKENNDSDEASLFQYQDGHGGERITCLRWSHHDDIFVSAGNGVIQVWDATQRGEMIQPLWTLHHPGVRCVEFSPGRHRNILVTGGEGGLKFWNLRNGTLRSSFPMEVGNDGACNVVTGMVWSCRNELLVSHGNYLSMWDPDQETKIAQVNTKEGRILSMDQGPNGRIACIHEDEVVAGYSIIGGRSKMAYQCRGSLRKPGLFA